MLRCFKSLWGGLLLGILFIIPVSNGLSAPLGPYSALTPGQAKEVENVESPRFMLQQFLELSDVADLDALFPFVEFPRGYGLEGRRELLRKLIEVLNKRGNIDLALVSNDPKGRLTDSPYIDFEKIGVIRADGKDVSVDLRLVTEKNRQAWKFSADFMEKVPDIADALAKTGLEGRMPKILVENEYFGIKLWQILGLVAALLIAYLTSVVLAWIIFQLMRLFAKRLQIQASDAIFRNFIAPMRLFTGIFIFSSSIFFLDTNLRLRQRIGYIETIALTLTFCMFAIRLTKSSIEMSRLSYERQGKHSSTAMLGPIRKGITVVIVVLAAVSLMRNLGFDVTAIIAGLGIGGLAIALAGQKTIENLFGGISIIMDQPVRVGDFGRFGDVLGTVEDIGLRSTKVRTLDRTIVTIPNAEFSHMKLENFERRDKIRWVTVLGIRLESSTDQMRVILVRLKELLLAHPMVYNDPARVRFTGFGVSALNIEIFAYIKSTEYSEFISVVEDLNLRILDIIRDCGTDLALPSQLNYTAGGDRLFEKQKEAHEAIAAMKEAGTYPLPHYDAAWAEPRTDTLSFPPKT